MKFTKTFIILVCITLSLAKKTPEAPATRKNPNAMDVGLEVILQNTARVAEENGAFKSNVDIHPARYKILTGDSNKALLDPPRIPYPKDKQAYYPFVDPAKTIEVKEPINVPTFTPRHLYEKDKSAYYNPTGIFRVLPNPHPHVGTEVPILLDDLQDKFPTEQNLKTLQNRLEAIRTKDDIAANINAISEKGIYMGDPKPYYDPTLDDTLANVSQIQGSIINMEDALNNQIRNAITAKLGTEKVHREIQHIENHNAEALDKKMKDNYYTPVGKDINGNNVELQPGNLPAPKLPTPPTTYGPRVEVDVPTHNLEEAVEVAGQLPDKYVNRKVANKNLRNKITVAPPTVSSKSSSAAQKKTFTPLENHKSLSTEGFAKSIQVPKLSDSQKLDQGFHEAVKKFKKHLHDQKAVK